MPNKTIEINGGNVVYEILGKQGDFIVLTPAADSARTFQGCKPLARALVKGGYRVLLWDRPNCGKSDVQFYGQSESHMRAETLQQLITKLDIGPCIIAGGSGGARDSMLTTMLYPELVTKLVVWNIVGGVYGSFVLGGHYITPSILAVRGLGIKGLLQRPRMARANRGEPRQRGALPRTRRGRVPQGHVALAQRVRVQARPDHPRRPRRDVRRHQGARR